MQNIIFVLHKQLLMIWNCWFKIQALNVVYQQWNSAIASQSCRGNRWTSNDQRPFVCNTNVLVCYCVGFYYHVTLYTQYCFFVLVHYENILISGKQKEIMLATYFKQVWYNTFYLLWMGSSPEVSLTISLVLYIIKHLSWR